jgi:hypothetical protein
MMYALYTAVGDGPQTLREKGARMCCIKLPIFAIRDSGWVRGVSSLADGPYAYIMGKWLGHACGRSLRAPSIQPFPRESYHLWSAFYDPSLSALSESRCRVVEVVSISISSVARSSCFPLRYMRLSRLLDRHIPRDRLCCAYVRTLDHFYHMHAEISVDDSSTLTGSSQPGSPALRQFCTVSNTICQLCIPEILKSYTVYCGIHCSKR